MKKSMFVLASSLICGSFASAGPVAYWQMNDGSGTVVSDASGNGISAQGTNIAWAKGVGSPAITLKTDGFLEVQNCDKLNPSEAISLEAWIAPWKPNFKDSPRFLHKDGAYSIGFTTDKKIGVSLWLNGEMVELKSKCTSFPAGKWVHVAATFDGENIALYLNGKKDAEMAASGKISASTNPLYIASNKSRQIFWNSIDEVKIFDRAISANDVTKSFDKGNYEVARQDAYFSKFFHKGAKRDVKAVVPGYIWVDAEDFADYGGWWMDTQFVPQMGSPYLMAAGIGEPVDDAKTSVTVDRDGKYKLWVRTKNWIKDHNPGKFEVTVNGQTSKTTFGTEPIEEWIWQDGGTFELKAGKVDLSLHDLTGFYGRCDTLLLTRDMHYKPPFSFEGYKGERRRLTGEGLDEVTVGNYDVVVVGGGVAGINAAISSARMGAKTALIQDRPMIGGNNSPEMGVPVLGPADFGKKNARESGLNEEIGRLRSYNFMQKWSQGAEVIIEETPNLTLFLNTRVYDVERSTGNRITAVRGVNMIDGKLTRYGGAQFIDCTGDGWVGYYAGAEMMRGREDKNAFNESNAPDDFDSLTMSGSLFQASHLGYTSKELPTPQKFEAPSWVWDISFNTKNLESRKRNDNVYRSGTWWCEATNDYDDMWNPESARDALIRSSFTLWNWVKNDSPRFKKLAEKRVLSSIPITNAKRETSRLVGDYVMSQNDPVTAKHFDDAIATGGWGLDIHHPKALFSTEGPFDYNTHTPLYNIPFRILYSKNVPNLLMAGRHVSCTHAALGTLRVQATTGVMGQAAGTAAGMCIENSTDPRGIYLNHIKELQQQLLKDDQYIIGVKNEDSDDLARGAEITATSEKSEAFCAENAINGVSRVVDKEMNMWASDPNQALPQSLELNLGKAEEMNSVYLTFDTDVNDSKRATDFKDSERMPPEAARDYQVQILESKKGILGKAEWKTVADVKGNYQRRRIHRFENTKASKIRVVISATNGDKSARIYEVRAYKE